MEMGTTQKLTWKVRVIYGIISGIAFTVILILIDGLILDELRSVLRYVLQGLFFGVLMAVMMGIASKKLPKWLGFNRPGFAHPGLQPDEKIEFEGPANLFRGIEGVGGKLFLTNQKVIFNSHKINIQRGQTNIDYSDIARVEKRRTLKIIPNGLRVITVDSKNYNFVVNNREQWMVEFNKRLPVAGHSSA
jgi:hypothetical protein